MNYWKNKKVLVTGGKGFLGHHVVDTLIEHGVERENIFIPFFPEHDLRRMDDCMKIVKGIDIVIHLAGLVGGIEFSRANPGRMFYDNAAMALNIIEATRLEGVEKFIGIGSVCAYPKIIQVPFKEESLWDGYPEETNAPYGLAKKMLLVQSQAYKQQYGFNAIYLLPVNMYGPGDNFDNKSSHVIAAIIKKVYEAKKQNKNYIEVWGTGEVSREFLYIKDGAEAIVLASEKYNKSEPVNIGSGMEIFIKNLVELICKLMDFNGEIRWDRSKPDGQPRRCLDVSKAETEFGFKAKVDFEQGLKKTIQWYQEKTKQNYEC